MSRAGALAVGLVSLPRARRSSTGWWVIAAVTITANLAITAYIGATATKPAFAFDEIHLLQAGRLAAGQETPILDGAGYFPLWGLLLAPFWLLWDDPDVVYRAAAILGWCFAAGSIPLLGALARRFRLTWPQALTAGAIVMSLPGRAVQADYVLSERLLFFVLALAALAAFRLWERPTIGRAFTMGTLLALAYFTHMRMLPVLLASGIWLIAMAWKNWRAALTGILTLGVLSAAAHWAGTRINLILMGKPADQSEGVWAALEQMRPGLFFRVALGQTWNLVVGSYGLVVVGIVAVVVLCWREVRRFRMGRAVWIFGVFTATWVLSVITWATDWNLYENPWVRLDSWIYGRYTEPVAAFVCLVGLSVVLRGIRSSVWAAGMAAALVVVTPTVLVLSREAPAWGYVTPAHIGGVLPWAFGLTDDPSVQGEMPTFAGPNSFWLWASLTALAFLILYRVARRLPALIALVLTAALAIGSVGVNAASDSFRELEAPRDAYFDELDELIDDFGPLEIAWDFACDREASLSGVGNNVIGYEIIADDVITSFRSDEEPTPDVDIVLTCARPDAKIAEEGALPLADYDLYGSWVWVMPGDLQDRLRAEGRLDTDVAG